MELTVLELSRKLRALSAEAHAQFIRGGTLRLMAEELRADLHAEISTGRPSPRPMLVDLSLDSGDSVSD